MCPDNRTLHKSAGDAAKPAEEISKEGCKLARRRANHNFMVKFTERIVFEAGFKLVNEKEIKEKLVAAGLWGKGRMLPVVRDDEFVFNRGIGSCKSNFFVFTKSDSGGVTVYFSNPAAPANARRDELYVRFRFTGGDEGEAAENAVAKVLEYAAKKPEDEYRAVTHQHWGFVEAVRVMDDGVSKFEDVLRMMMLCHMDLDMSTPHNALETRLDAILVKRLGIRHDFIKFLQIIEEGLGIVKVPGTELTMALKANDPNGPHVCVWLGGKEAMGVFAEEILAKRDPKLQMQSYFTGMGFADMRTVLYKLMRLEMAAVGIAHPINYNSPSLPVLDVGLVSSSVRGGLPLDYALEFARECQAVGCWNPTMDGSVMPTRGKDWRGLRPKLLEWLDSHNANTQKEDYWVRHDANTLGMAFAEYMRRVYGLGTMFDGDCHVARPIIDEAGQYNAGGDIMNMGHTVVVLGDEPKAELARKDRKPTPEELVRWLVGGRARMDAVVHTVHGQGGLDMGPSRLAVPAGQRDTSRMLEALKMQAYAGEILGDLGYWIGAGQWRTIGEMTG